MGAPPAASNFVEISMDNLASRRSFPDLSAHVSCTPQLAVPAGFTQAAAPYAESGPIRIDAREPEHLEGEGI